MSKNADKKENKKEELLDLIEANVDKPATRVRRKRKPRKEVKSEFATAMQ